jgi:branched-chain amino acid transport system substrate-binding protein
MVMQWKKVAAVLPALLLAALASTPAVAQDCEVKLGAVGPMSGGAAAWGLSAKTGAEFVAALYNQDGGLPMGSRKCKVKVVSFDSQYTAAGGAAASNYLASENVHVTVGPVGSPETTAFRPLAKRSGQINFSSSYMGGVIGPEFPLAFHALQSPVTWGPLMVKAAADQFKFKNVTIVGANDAGGTDATKQLIKIYDAAGIKATEEYYQRGTTNFEPIAQRLMIANPGAVDMATMPPQDASVLAKSLIEAGYKGVLGALGGVGAPPIIQGAGGVDKLKGGFYWLEVSPIDHPGVVKMKADYARVMKAAAPDNPLFPVFVAAAEVALHGISLAGTDQDPGKIAAALRKTTPESRYMGKSGWRGKSIYGVNQELSFPIGLGLVVDGKKLPVRTIDIPSEQ